MEAERRRTSFSSVMLILFLKGVLMSAISGVAASCGAAIIKYMKNIPSWQLMCYAYWGCFSFALPWAIWTGEHLLGPRGLRLTIFIRCVITVIGFVLQAIAYRYLPLAESIVLSTSSPIFVTIAAKIFLKESLDLLKLISLITSIVGIILITGVFQVTVQGTRLYTTDDIYGVAAALSAVCFIAAQIIITRKIRHVHHSVLMLNTSVVCILFTTIFTTCVSGFSLHYKGLQQGFIILLGVFCFVSQTAFFLALKLTEAGPATTVRVSTTTLVGFLLQMLLFDDVTDSMGIIGAMLMLSSVILIAMSKYINSFFTNNCLFNGISSMLIIA